MDEITPPMLLNAYANGYFPMAKSRVDTELHWFHPKQRGIIPLEQFHVPRSLAKALEKTPFEIRISTDFPAVIRACAEREDDTWINQRIENLYIELWEMGFAHSVECYRDQKLVGGLYGVSLGGAFFGESMFSRVSNASKAALVHLVGRLNAAGYQLLDTQYVNEHLLQFGVQEIPQQDYMVLLEKALNTSPNPSSRFLTVSPINN